MPARAASADGAEPAFGYRGKRPDAGSIALPEKFTELHAVPIQLDSTATVYFNPAEDAWTIYGARSNADVLRG